VGTVTVAELLEQWYERTRYDFATTTRQTTEGAMRVLVDDFGAVSVDALRPRHLDDWHTTRRAQGYSRAYSVRISGVLSAACAWGIRRDLCETNPVANARQKREKGRKVKSPTPETVKAALALAQKTDPTLFLFLRIDTITGARRSEILGLTRDDFDPDLRTLTIRRVVVPTPGGLAIEERTKSDAGARVVSIDEDTVTWIQKAVAAHDSPWLFPGRDPSQPMYPTSITHKVQKLGQLLGVRIHPHCLRHFCATQSLGAGVPLPIVAARLGDTVGTITKVYAHALRSDDRGAADALADTIR
jgi:integrase